MSPHPTKTAIVTVTYNCGEFIEDFLLAAKGQLADESLPTTIILVDNNSTDDTVEKITAFIEKYGFSNKILLCLQETNLGFGAGCNAGVATAKKLNPEYYWFLNPDTKIFSDTLPKLIECFTEHPNAGFIGSQLVNESGVPRPSAFRFPSIVSEFCGRVRLGILDRIFSGKQIAMPVSDMPHQADWLTGASFLAKSAIFEQLQGFDERFFLYFEEVDLFYRAKQHGIESWINPESQVFHFAGASTGIASGRSSPKRRPQYWFDSRRYFFCKNYGKVHFLAADLATMAGLVLWKLRALVQQKEDEDPPYFLTDIARNSLFRRARSR